LIILFLFLLLPRQKNDWQVAKTKRNKLNMRKSTLLIVLLLIGIFCSATRVQAQKWAVKTNLLYWATGTLNAGAELKVSKHSTFNLTCNLNPWTYGADNKIQHWFIRPEYRYWVTEAHTRLFFGVHVMGGGFEIGGFNIPIIGDKIGGRLKNFVHNYRNGTFVAAGIGLGYAFYLSPHLNLEVSGGVGLARIKHHAEPTPTSPYANTHWRGDDRVDYLPMPTELSISLVYLFNGKNKK